jgi:hypothetical protein
MPTCILKSLATYVYVRSVKNMLAMRRGALASFGMDTIVLGTDDEGEPITTGVLSRRVLASPALKNLIIQGPGAIVRTGTIIAGRALFTAGRTPWSWNDSKPPACPGE